MHSLLEKEETVEELICDLFGNYVIQKAIPVSRGENYIKILSRVANSYKKLINIPFGPSLYDKLNGIYPELKTLGNESINFNNTKNEQSSVYMNQMNYLSKMNQQQMYYPMQNSQYGNYYPMQMQNYHNMNQNMNWNGMMPTHNQYSMYNNAYVDSNMNMNNPNSQMNQMNKKKKRFDKRN